MNIEHQYRTLLRSVMEHGEERDDRTGVGTKALFGAQIRGWLHDGFPALTTKRVAFKACAAELLWFLEGSGDERRLAEITHGTRDTEKVTIWTPNAMAPYWKPKAKYEGDLGRVYGVQWRSWRNIQVKRPEWPDGEQYFGTDGSIKTITDLGVTVTEYSTDQIGKIIHTIKTNPTDRRMILSAYNVGELDQMALPPCHMFAQFYVSTKRQELSCQVYIRSNDLFLGLPFNIASYALLTQMLAQVTGLKPGELIVTIGDAHIYKNHFDAVEEQMSRTPRELPILEMNPAITDIDGFKLDDFKLINYNPYDAIKAPMAV